MIARSVNEVTDRIGITWTIVTVVMLVAADLTVNDRFIRRLFLSVGYVLLVALLVLVGYRFTAMA